MAMPHKALGLLHDPNIVLMQPFYAPMSRRSALYGRPGAGPLPRVQLDHRSASADRQPVMVVRSVGRGPEGDDFQAEARFVAANKWSCVSSATSLAPITELPGANAHVPPDYPHAADSSTNGPRGAVPFRTVPKGHGTYAVGFSVFAEAD
jgi:hypothetical protein